jgi:hypothetical protein
MMAAANDLKMAEDALKDPKFKGPYEFEGEKYTLSDLRDVLVPLLKKRAAAAEKRKTETQAGAASLRNQIARAQESVDFYTKNLATERNRFQRNRISEEELAAAEQKLADAVASRDALSTRAAFPTPTAPGTVVDAAEEVRMRTEAFGGRPSPVAPTEEPVTSTGVSPAAPVRVTKADVDAALASSGLPDTPANRKQIREDLKAGNKPQADWETLVAQRAGEYAYLLDPKFEGLPELLRKAVEKDWFDSPEGEKQFLQEFAKTPYALNADANQEKFDLSDPGTKRSLIELQIDNIRSQYGEIQFDQTTLEEVATTAARNKSTNIELGRLVYRAAFKRGAAEPAFGESVAAKTALGGEDVARVRAIYRAYGQTADDQQIARILAGDVDPASGVVMTEDMLRNNLRDIAKVSYKPFADLLDRGISVETIFQPYKQIAASVLEKTPDEVELIDASGKPSQFASALMMKEPMSLTDWITTLKSDKSYGWQFTSEAKQKATSLVMDLEKSFGFRA